MPIGHQPRPTDHARRKMLVDWIKAVRDSGEYRTLNRWMLAASVPPPTLYRFLNGETNSIAAHNLTKLQKATRVRLELA